MTFLEFIGPKKALAHGLGGGCFIRMFFTAWVSVLPGSKTGDRPMTGMNYPLPKINNREPIDRSGKDMMA